MKRRDFLKTVGVAVTAPIALAKPSPEAKGKITPNIEPETGAKKDDVAGQPFGEDIHSNKYYQWDAPYHQALCCHIGDIVLLKYLGFFMLEEYTKVRIVSIEPIYNHSTQQRPPLWPVSYKITAIPFYQTKTISGRYFPEEPIMLYIIDESNNMEVHYEHARIALKGSNET